MISLNRVVFSSKIYFSFSFCSDFNLEATVVKTDEIRGLKQLFTPYFLLIGKKIQNNKLPHSVLKKSRKNYNDRTFN